MIHKLSTGVEVSENTIVSALKKAGINVELKHIFKAGDVVESMKHGGRRLIVKIDGILHAVNSTGCKQATGQNKFEALEYKYIGKCTDFTK